jgi:hypothetical protein
VVLTQHVTLNLSIEKVMTNIKWDRILHTQSNHTIS